MQTRSPGVIGRTRVCARCLGRTDTSPIDHGSLRFGHFDGASVVDSRTHILTHRRPAWRIVKPRRRRGPRSTPSRASPAPPKR
jgi:hypothetical protein